LSRFREFSPHGSRLIDQCLKVYTRLRERSTGLRKLPATAELISWLRILQMQRVQPGDSLFEVPNWEQTCATILAKTAEDSQIMRAALAQYRAEHS
jgi:hypothetical protein